MSTDNDDTTPNVEPHVEPHVEPEGNDIPIEAAEATPEAAETTLDVAEAMPDVAEPAEPRKRHGALIAVAIATAAVVCIGGLGTAGVAILTSHTSTSSTQTTHGSFGQSFPQNGQQNGQGGQQGFGQGGVSGGQALGEQAVAGESAATPATAAQEVGLVTINTTLDYTSEDQAAGTGMILTSNGYILTNNHVIESSTSIKVTVESTGKTYTATVVGTNATADVAVLKLQDASGLSTVNFAPSEKVTVGEAIHSVGNAEGTGNLVTATGTVGAVDQNLTVASDSTGKNENLTGLIQLESDVVSGDSGGPLYDSSGDVIGIVTAASTGSANVTGYAINIAQVLKVVDEIEAGTPADGVVYGYPAFLGIELATDTGTTSGGVPVAGVFENMPAAKAGIAKGDVITGVDGTKVTTGDELSSAIQKYKVGQQVTIDWQDAQGGTHQSTVTLIAGPAA